MFMLNVLLPFFDHDHRKLTYSVIPGMKIESCKNFIWIIFEYACAVRSQ